MANPTRSRDETPCAGSEAQDHLRLSLSVSDARHDKASPSTDFFKKMYDRTSALGKIGVWECDLTTEALTWTDTVYDLFELPRQSLISRSVILKYYEPNSRRNMERLRAEAIASNSTFTVDVQINTAQGNSRWIRITGDVEQEDGRSVRIFGTKQDVTFEKTAQLQVLALQSELIHLSRASAMDAMRSTLAHELNQPLAAIAIYVSTMRKLIDGEVIDQQAAREILNGVERCALKADDIIRGVRNLATGQQPAPISFDLAIAVREACSIALAGAPTNVQVTYALEDGLLAIGDPVQIQQVVINLMRNACEALLGCKKAKILVSSDRVSTFAEVCVRDSGPGIAPQVIETLFDSFVSTKPGGTGLGLAISRTIVEAHSGRLTATNDTVGGASFRLTLPMPDLIPG